MDEYLHLNLCLFILASLIVSCGQNHHITNFESQSDTEIVPEPGPTPEPEPILSFPAIIIGSNTVSKLGSLNNKIGLIEKFTDNTNYNDDGLNPSLREKEWIFKVNGIEVGRITFQTLTTSITNPGSNSIVPLIRGLLQPTFKTNF